MKLVLKGSDFDHLKDRSDYKNNYYKHRQFEYIVLEKCDEVSNSYEFYLIENEWEIFIGCSMEEISEKGITTIDFKLLYT